MHFRESHLVLSHGEHSISFCMMGNLIRSGGFQSVPWVAPIIVRVGISSPVAICFGPVLFVMK